MPCDAHIVRPRAPNSTPMTAATAATATTTGVSIGFLPSGPDHAAGRVTYTKARSRTGGGTVGRVSGATCGRSMRLSGPPRWAAIGPILVRYAVTDRRL